MKLKRTQNSQNNIKTQGQGWRTHTSHEVSSHGVSFKTYHKAVVIRTVWCCHADRQKMSGTKQSLEKDPCKWPTDFEQGCQDHPVLGELGVHTQRIKLDLSLIHLQKLTQNGVKIQI